MAGLLLRLLSEDSDDEKRLFRTESRAGCKIKAKAIKAMKPASNRGCNQFFNQSGFGSSEVKGSGFTPQQPFPELGAARQTPSSSANSIGYRMALFFSVARLGLLGELVHCCHRLRNDYCSRSCQLSAFVSCS